jgi:Mrp family chromosome partitioning ATPase
MSKITVTVSGETGSGKSAIALEIEIALKAIGVSVKRMNPDTMVHAESQTWIDLYKPEVEIVEVNIPRRRQPGWMGDIGGTPYGPSDQ